MNAGLRERDRTPAATRSRSRRRRAPAPTRRERRRWHARCTATSDDEHAVSTARLGPRKIEEVRQAIGQRCSSSCPCRGSRRCRRGWCELRAGSSRTSSAPTNTPVRLPAQRARRRSPRPRAPPTRRRMQQPLLRIHRRRFARRDAEELGVEVADRRRRSRPTASTCDPARPRIRIVERVDCPSDPAGPRRWRRARRRSSSQNAATPGAPGKRHAIPTMAMASCLQAVLLPVEEAACAAVTRAPSAAGSPRTTMLRRHWRLAVSILSVGNRAAAAESPTHPCALASIAPRQ